MTFVAFKIYSLFACVYITYVYISFSGDSTQDSITSLSSAVSFKEDQTVSLSCNYSYTVNMNNLQWYRQYSNSEPQFIVLVAEYRQNQTADSDPRLSAHLHTSVKRVDLLISSAAVSDSALYYCALQPTVTGKHRQEQ
uniref:Ig-like domain-containing protein n=1 Tax=Electrophorus electricus TaxID=8005 RepID=A0A4W4ENH2_ELEEL